ncbi:MAG: hypothetical protein M0Z75_18055 [Nitrospiraceae bacterium]|nr:hypothetical protein [Nitrospiraceae bacterium]
MGGGLSILVASESLFIRHYFSYLFERNNTLRLAASGREAIEEMARPPGTEKFSETTEKFFRPFDLVFINDYLPDMGAVELLEKIVSGHPGAKTFVLLTHSNDAKRLVERHGATGVIMKPFTTSDVLTRVREALPAEKVHIRNDLSFYF